MSIKDDVRRNLRRDLHEDFLRAAGISVGWALADQADMASSLPGQDLAWKLEWFNRTREQAVIDALRRICDERKVPYDYRRLRCNGQRKLMFKLGNTLLIPEAAKSVQHRPEPADYKVELAAVHAVTRQLELPLGDVDPRITDLSNSMLATFLYSTNPFVRDGRITGLTRLEIAVPDATYNSWVAKEDITALALEGKRLTTALEVDHTVRESFKVRAIAPVYKEQEIPGKRND